MKDGWLGNQRKKVGLLILNSRKEWENFKIVEKSCTGNYYYLLFVLHQQSLYINYYFIFRYLEAFPRLQTYLKVAKFELKNHNPASARLIFEKIPTDLGDEAYREDYFLTFARFEIRNKEYDRARAIFKFGLEKIPKERAGGLYEEYLVFEKQWGAKEEIDGLIISKRRNKYKGIAYLYLFFLWKNYDC